MLLVTCYQNVPFCLIRKSFDIKKFKALYKIEIYLNQNTTFSKTIYD